MPHVDHPLLSEPLEDGFKNDTSGPMALRVGPGTCYLLTRCWLSLLVLIESWHISGQSFLDLNLILVLEKADQLLALTPSLGLGTSALGSGKERQHRSYSLSLSSSPAATPSACPPVLAQPRFSLTGDSPDRPGGRCFKGSILLSIPPEQVSVFSENTTPVEMFAIFLAKCYFFHIRGLISCHSWRVLGGRRVRKLGPEGNSD